MGRSFSSRVKSRLVRLDLARAERGGLQERLVRDRRVRSMVDHARSASPLYRDLYGETSRRAPLASLPVATKRELMDRFDDWVTDREITLEGVQAFVADKSKVGEPYLGRYLVAHTAGSSGVKALIVRDRAALRVHNLLMERRQMGGASTRTGDSRRAVAAIVKLGGHHTIYAGWKFAQEGVPAAGAPDVHFFSIYSPVEQLVRELNEFQPTVVNSSPAMLLELAERQSTGALAIHPRVVLSGGETLTPAAYDALTGSFGCPVRNIYGSTEFKFIAFGCDRGWLHVNDDRVIVEAVDRNRQPVPPGTVSDSMLLTDLINRTQPLIRYEMGDRILVKPEPCECDRPFTPIRVEGRTRTLMAFRNPQGERVPLHPSVIESLFFDRPEVLQYQIVQKGVDELRVRLRLDDGDEELVWHGFLSGLGAVLDEHGLGFVTVVRAAEPPVMDSVTGKVQQIIIDGE